MANNLMTFGKYKGKSVDEVIAIDPNYVNWLLGQGWFAEKEPTIYQTIINLNQEVAETPEHNALQAQFLDDAYCWALVECLDFPDATYHHPCRYSPDAWKGLVEDVQKQAMIWRRKIAEAYRAYRNWREREKQPSYMRLSLASYVQVSRENRAKLRRLSKATGNDYGLPGVFVVPDPCETSFERQDIDVVMKVRSRTLQLLKRLVQLDYWATSLDLGQISNEGDAFWRGLKVVLTEPLLAHSGSPGSIGVEIKPSIGDDFPAVLRQIEKAKARTQNRVPIVLYVDQFSARGVTREQMVEMFARSGVPVIFKAVVDAKASEIRALIGSP
jgi:hypothetical protein